jgi:hypothetical protein
MSGIRLVVVALFAHGVAGNAPLSLAQEAHVFKVHADLNKLSGFRMKGMRGIITALHGVVGTENIRAKSASDDIVLENLEIVAVDIKRDIALISNRQVDEEGEGVGFVPSNGTATPQMPLTLIGYPLDLGFKELKTHITLRDPPTEALKNLLTKSLFSQLQFRGSPDPALQILALEGEILPGHSGAPLVDGKHRVIGIGDGGLGGVFEGLGTEIGWAIPVASISFSPLNHKTRRQLSLLEEMSPLFSIKRTLDKPVTISKIEQENGSTKVWGEGKVSRLPDGTLRVLVELKVRKSGVAGTGYGTAVVELLDIRGNTLWESKPIKKHVGADVLIGTASKEKRFSTVVPGNLGAEVVDARLFIKAEETSGFDVNLRDLMEAVSVDL